MNLPDVPTRLRSDGPGFARRLIESASADEVPEASLRRMAEALKLPSEALRGPALARGARFGAPRLVVGLVSAGLVGVIVAVAWRGQNGEHSSTPPAPDVAVHERTVAESVPSTPELEAPRELPASAAPKPPSRAEAPPRHAAPSSGRAAHATAARTAAVPLRDLRAELVALEAVQSALSAQRSSAAEALLEDYRRRFPDGELMLESELLRVEVMSARGEPERALTVADRLLARSDMDRYRSRLEALKLAAERLLERSGQLRETVVPAPAEKANARGQKPAPLDMAVQEQTR